MHDRRLLGLSNAAITAVAALEDDLRRAMYGFIRAAHHPVTREQAAQAVGISVKLATFHLDKLVHAGLLRSYFPTATGLRKVGRTAKAYEPADVNIAISLPQREHDLLAAILVDAVATQEVDEPVREAVLRAARTYGQALATATEPRSRQARIGAERAITIAQAVLADHGYQPDRKAPGELRLRNCPFQPLAARQPELVCGLNQAFLTGFLDGLNAHTVSAVLQPTPDQCCVRLLATLPT